MGPPCKRDGEGAAERSKLPAIQAENPKGVTNRVEFLRFFPTIQKIQKQPRSSLSFALSLVWIWAPPSQRPSRLPSNTRLRGLARPQSESCLSPATSGLRFVRFLPRSSCRRSEGRAHFTSGGAPIVLSFGLIFLLPESISFLALRRSESPDLRAVAARLDPDVKSGRPARFVLREEKQGGVPARYSFTEGRAAITLLLWVRVHLQSDGAAFPHESRIQNWSLMSLQQQFIQDGRAACQACALLFPCCWP